jgi:hypothetical protein
VLRIDVHTFPLVAALIASIRGCMAFTAFAFRAVRTRNGNKTKFTTKVATQFSGRIHLAAPQQETESLAHESWGTIEEHRKDSWRFWLMRRGARLWTGGDEVIYSILDVMYAKAPYTTIRRARIFTDRFGVDPDHARPTAAARPRHL